MSGGARDPRSPHGWALVGLLLAVGGLYLLRLDAPLTDGIPVKQVYVAHRARQIAAPPFDLGRNTFDFLTDTGEPLTLAEEIPLYAGVVAAGYRAFGEREWLGRLLSAAAAVAAVAALYDLVRRNADRTTALVAAYLFAFTPLLLFYGRAFQPDAAMLACMLLAACAYDRYLDRPSLVNWLAAAAFCLLAVAFKYYGVMVLLSLAILTLQRQGLAWPGVAGGLGLLAATGGLLGWWMATVYLTTHNPNADPDNAYFVHQRPALLADVGFYVRFFDRFLYRDCGPVLLVLSGVGVAAVLRRRASLPAPTLGWGVTGVLFFVLMAPKVLHHSYYELMMLPPTAVWGAVGWVACWRRAGRGGRVALAAVLAAVPAVHTLWGEDGLFQQARGLHQIGRRMGELCPAGERFAVLGTFGGVVPIHYSGRQGWESYQPNPATVDRYRRQGARYLVIYMDRTVPAGQRDAYRAIAAGWPEVERGVEVWDTRDGSVEYYILRLDPP